MPSLTDIVQCWSELSSEEEGEGCNMHGIVKLSTGGGNLHLALSHDLEEAGTGKKNPSWLSTLDCFIQMFEQFNLSHMVHKVWFGAKYPGNVNQLLDGEVCNIEDGYGMYQYYFQV